MLRYMLDTNICIAVAKNTPIGLMERFSAWTEQLCISSITLGEWLYGAEKSQRREQNITVINDFCARLEVLDFDPQAAAHYGQIRAELERAGRLIGSNDMLIAAHARSQGLIVVTNNGREYERVPGLRVENWLAE
jgi:tRNA(fMet)-specific endonuclease VapC